MLTRSGIIISPLRLKKRLTGALDIGTDNIHNMTCDLAAQVRSSIIVNFKSKSNYFEAKSQVKLKLSDFETGVRLDSKS